MRSGSVIGLSVILLVLGCGKEEVRVYSAPKDASTQPAVSAPSAEATPVEVPAAGSGAAEEVERPGNPKVPWTVPSGWQSRPNASGMRLASYGVTTADGRSVDISVVALGENAGTELENVNRWRGQLKLEPLTEEQLAGARDPVRVGGEPGFVYDQVSTTPILDGKYRSRTLATMLPAGQMTVFFKATGEADLVGAEKSNFIAWLASVKTGPEGGEAERPAARPPATVTAPAAAAAPSLPPGPAAGLPEWKAPAHWKVGGPRTMRLASFEIPGEGNAVGDVSISTLSSGGGGLLANVNRWRGQVGLAPTDDATLAKEAKILTLSKGQKATVVDLGGSGPNRILGAIVPDGDKSWFFKLTGPDALVVKERENFLGWIQSVGL